MSVGVWVHRSIGSDRIGDLSDQPLDRGPSCRNCRVNPPRAKGVRVCQSVWLLQPGRRSFLVDSMWTGGGRRPAGAAQKDRGGAHRMGRHLKFKKMGRPPLGPTQTQCARTWAIAWLWHRLLGGFTTRGGGKDDGESGGRPVIPTSLRRGSSSPHFKHDARRRRLAKNKEEELHEQGALVWLDPFYSPNTHMHKAICGLLCD